MTVRDRKKQLISEIVLKDADAKAGMKLMRSSSLFILLSRFALLIYEAIYLSTIGLSAEILSYVFFALGIVGCYMIYDGNKGICVTLFIAAAIRILYHLTTLLPLLPVGIGATVFTVVNLAVLLTQAVLSIIPSLDKKCTAYANAMQKINLRLQGEIKR